MKRACSSSHTKHLHIHIIKLQRHATTKPLSSDVTGRNYNKGKCRQTQNSLPTLYSNHWIQTSNVPQISWRGRGTKRKQTYCIGCMQLCPFCCPCSIFPSFLYLSDHPISRRIPFWTCVWSWTCTRFPSCWCYLFGWSSSRNMLCSGHLIQCKVNIWSPFTFISNTSHTRLNLWQQDMWHFWDIFQLPKNIGLWKLETTGLQHDYIAKQQVGLCTHNGLHRMWSKLQGRKCTLNMFYFATIGVLWSGSNTLH